MSKPVWDTNTLEELVWLFCVLPVNWDSAWLGLDFRYRAEEEHSEARMLKLYSLHVDGKIRTFPERFDLHLNSEKNREESK